MIVAVLASCCCEILEAYNSKHLFAHGSVGLIGEALPRAVMARVALLSLQATDLLCGLCSSCVYTASQA